MFEARLKNFETGERWLSEGDAPCELLRRWHSSVAKRPQKSLCSMFETCTKLSVEMWSNEWKAEFEARRARVFERIGDGVVVLFGAQGVRRNADTEYDFRQDSSFYYLTGFPEPNAALVLSGRQRTFALFVPPKDPEREIWEGRRAGVPGAMEVYGADEAHSIDELASKLPDYLENAARLLTPFELPSLVDPRLSAAIFAVRGRRRRRVDAPRQLEDFSEVLAELRVQKSPLEIAAMEKSADATRLGHVAAMQSARPGQTEFDVQRVLEDGFRKGGCRYVAYTSIVGAGENATILHYRDNDAPLEAGQLLLIDAGAEWCNYACDVTRTFPVGAEFTPAQREVYDLVLAAQKRAIAETRVGQTMDEIHEIAMNVIEEGLLSLGIVDARRSEGARRPVNKYFMHRTSHFLGLDVHDVGRSFRQGQPEPLDQGMVITVEPGVYIALDDLEVPERYRGIGIRIEDDVLVTESDPLVLTASIPKEVSEIEHLRALAFASRPASRETHPLSAE